MFITAFLVHLFFFKKNHLLGAVKSKAREKTVHVACLGRTS